MVSPLAIQEGAMCPDKCEPESKVILSVSFPRASLCGACGGSWRALDGGVITNPFGDRTGEENRQEVRNYVHDVPILSEMASEIAEACKPFEAADGQSYDETRKAEMEAVTSAIVAKTRPRLKGFQSDSAAR